jgi:hypothetical protein
MKISLTGGDDQSRSIISSCQRSLNLYIESTDPKLNEPGQVTHYPTPGRTLLSTTPNGLPARGLYRATNGILYCVAGFDVYYIDSSWTFHFIGTMNKTKTLLPTKMADNGTNVILCDGTATNGYSILMSTNSGLTPLYNPSASDEFTSSSVGWLGSNFVDFSDGYFIANFIGTPTFYISNSEDVIFDPLQFAGKTSFADFALAAVVQHRVIWLVGILSTEVWYNTGGTTTSGEAFPFSIMPGVAIDWGCAATYSIAKAETAIFWLAQNLNGETVVLRGSGYNVSRISNHALEYQLSSYANVSDCIAYCYLQNGHSFYVMNFPSADKTWVFDLSMAQWHERCFMDNNGNEHMQLSTCHAFAYGTNVVNDWTSGNIYSLDLNAFTDNGQPIKRLIGFPRQVDQEADHRILYRNFVAEMDCGESLLPNDDPMVTLRWSDDKGRTFSNGMLQSLGKTGHYEKFMKWNRLGTSRNRVFQMEWSVNAFTAVQGAWVDVEKTAA